jgi:hypothetical protein
MANYPLKIPNDPALFDKVALEARSKMKAAFSWLNEVYLSSAAKVDEDGRYFPVAEAQGGNYIDLRPDASLGNYAFFELDQSQELEAFPNHKTKILGRFSLILFFDFREVYPADYDTRTAENVKRDWLIFFETIRLKTANVILTGVTTEKDQIYRGYDVKDLVNKFLVRPFGAIRFEGEAVYRTNC